MLCNYGSRLTLSFWHIDCNLSSEAPRDQDFDKLLDEEWPTGGGIQFRNAKMRYRPGLPLVLKDLDLRIPARSKVGIVGRTGAGKCEWIFFVLKPMPVLTLSLR